MTPEVETQVRNVRKFGRYGSWFCGLGAALLAIAFIVSAWNILSGPTWEGFSVALGPYRVTGDHMSSIPLKAWSLIVVTVVFVLLGGVVLHLQRLFSHLAAGRIYTRENVRHIRQVGVLALGMAAVQLVLPAATFALIEIGFIDRSLVSATIEGTLGTRNALLLGPASLSGFITAALVLLVSWIMDVGRETRDEAEVMRSEADLVI
jgi:signal transduction histidine kinase